ncbi:type II toxin-antitoxin system VapB family antitoxin [Spirosoma flavum]|uniref:Type II toxin-antitoxin system VapB family antitoxin n=1 Tax=Spirosoma flavum TaxID=2048557 RepID=A0ABW6AG43_9BACT
MRTNIDISDELLQIAMEISHAKTKKAVVELALQEYY